MRWWPLIRQFPKYALMAGIIVGSTLLFGTWWLFRSHGKARLPRDTAAEQAAIRERAAKVAVRIDYLFLADDDLYDAGTGECLFKNWLHGDHPVKLFYDQAAKKIIGQYDCGFARYACDGTREAAMMMPTPPAFVRDTGKCVFVRNKDLWMAEADWQAFKFVHERQVTTIGIFLEGFFAENVQLLTDKTLIFRSANNLLRVDLESGSVKPTRIPLSEIGKRRSPDSRWVVGMLNGQFYCYDVDADEGKTIPVGRTAINDFLWLNNDRCLGLAAAKAIVVYDRLGHTLTEAATLPFACFKIGEPSPDGRYLFAAGGFEGRNVALADLEKKTAVPVSSRAGITWVSNDTFAFSRDVPDSDWRGMWFQKVGDNEKRIYVEPYLVANGRAQLLALPSAGLIVFSEKSGLREMKLDGTKFTEFVKLSRPPLNLLGIRE